MADSRKDEGNGYADYALGKESEFGRSTEGARRLEEPVPRPIPDWFPVSFDCYPPGKLATHYA